MRRRFRAVRAALHVRAVPPAMTTPKASRARSLLATAVLTWPVFPMTLALADANLPPRMMLVSWCVFVTAAIVLLGLLHSVAGKAATVVVAIPVSIYCTLCTALEVYRLYTHEWLDLTLIAAVPTDKIGR